MNRIREVLLNEYIGAVALGLLLAQLIGIIIGLIMRPINFYLDRAAAPKGIFGSSDAEVFAWGSLVGPATNLILLTLITYLLFRWLYPNSEIQEESAAFDDTSEDKPESSGPS